MRRSAIVAAAIAALAACRGGPLPSAVEGRGLVSVDDGPPVGAETWDRPQLAVGDRFSYRRGGLVDLTYRVVELSDDGYLFEEETTGLRNSFTAELWITGQSMPGDASLDRTIAPYDAQLTWPLWVGKKWVSHFVRVGGGGGLPLIARYDCDAVEMLETPAGELECLRIWRRIRPAVEGEYFERNDLLWYAPEVGFFARKLEDAMLTELQGYQRQH